MTTVSICIPCYEMGGMGANMLDYSLYKIRKQTYKDFEVVISDHSDDDKLKKVCKQDIYKDLKIKYIKNRKNKGSSSANVNNCISNSFGWIIKILCQDDYLYQSDALELIVKNFNYNKSWLVGSYSHTKDRISFFNYHVPTLSDNILLKNTIGTHSCLSILNDKPLLFDEKLIWYMDSDYYHRAYLKFGEPVILKTPTMIQLLWEGQVTNTLITEELIKKEEKYLEKKYE